jgi:UDP-N-acetylglucosamine:LPS N-acetylglucosamine transferase
MKTIPRFASSKRICLAASSGGHLTQLLKLSSCWHDSDVFFVTTGEMVKQQLEKQGPVYIVGECNYKNIFQVFRVFAKCLPIIFQNRIDMVISTGAAVGCLMCFLAKIKGAKIIWIDSITNTEKLSLSGRLVLRIADLFLVQWPGLAKQNKKIECVGQLI